MIHDIIIVPTGSVTVMSKSNFYGCFGFTLIINFEIKYVITSDNNDL